MALTNSHSSREMELFSSLDQDPLLRLRRQPFDSSLDTSPSQEVLAFLGGLHRSSARVSRKRNRRRYRAKVQSGIKDVYDTDGQAPLQISLIRGHEELLELKACVRNSVERRAWQTDRDPFSSHENDANQLAYEALRDEMEAFQMTPKSASEHSQEYSTNNESVQRNGSKRPLQGSSQSTKSQRSPHYCEKEVAQGSKSDSKGEEEFLGSMLECKRSFERQLAEQLRPANPLLERLSDSTRSCPTSSDGTSSYYEDRRLQGKSRFALGDAASRFRDHSYRVPYAGIGDLAKCSLSASKCTEVERFEASFMDAEVNIVLPTGTEVGIDINTYRAKKLNIPHTPTQALDNVTRSIADSHGLDAVFLIIIGEERNYVGVGEFNRLSPLHSVNTVLSIDKDFHEQAECTMLASFPSEQQGKRLFLLGGPVIFLDELCRYATSSRRHCESRSPSTKSLYACSLLHQGRQFSTTAGSNRCNCPIDMETDLNSRRLGSPVWFKPENGDRKGEAVGGAGALKEVVVPLAQLVGPLTGSDPEDHTHTNVMRSTMPPYKPASSKSFNKDVQYNRYDIALVLQMREDSAKKFAKEEEFCSLKGGVARLLSQLQDLRYDDGSPVTIHPHHGGSLYQLAGRATLTSQPDFRAASRPLSAPHSSRTAESRDASAGHVTPSEFLPHVDDRLLRSRKTVVTPRERGFSDENDDEQSLIERTCACDGDLCSLPMLLGAPFSQQFDSTHFHLTSSSRPEAAISSQDAEKDNVADEPQMANDGNRDPGERKVKQ